MVEGPTAKAYAMKISQKFEGETVNDIIVKSKRVFIEPKELLHKRFNGSDTLGKNIILFFEDIAIRVHLMMFGSIHVYELDEPFLKPFERVRLLVKGIRRKLVVHNAPVIEIDRREKILNRLMSTLGPDPLSEGWSREKAFENLIRFGKEKIGTILLDQSVIAGIGNILRNEILFRAKISPERKVESLSEEEVERIIEQCELLSREFLRLKIEGKSIRQNIYVYNRYRGRCKYCGNSIRFYMQKPINRKTFVCENCQR